jgi:predicted aldo/keto reductase-like oxidoreductase
MFESRLHRREFLRRSALAGVGATLLPLSARGADSPPSVERRVKLGRTGLEVPDIGFGASRLSGDESLVSYAIDRGITHFDTATGYRGGDSERTLGRALRGRRDGITITSKAKIDADDDRDAMMRALEASLRRLATDTIDVYMNHAVNSLERVANPEWPEFVAAAKAQGKIRFCGMSGHGGRLAECVAHAIEHDLVDVMLLAHNFGQDPRFHQRFTEELDFVAIQEDLPPLMDRAREKGIGVMAMKTLRGGRLNDLRAYEKPDGTYAQAAFRWVLGSGHADSLVVTMKTREQIDEYLGASGHTRVTGHDAALLLRYEAANGATRCRHGCDACEGACPEGVPIGEVLRTRMYDVDYADRALAREDYATLGSPASVCASCSHTACAGSCPVGLDVSSLLRPVHGRLG